MYGNAEASKLDGFNGCVYSQVDSVSYRMV